LWGFDWKYYGTNEEGSYFYEKESMKFLSGNHLRVWVQSVYTEKGISHWVKEGGKEFQDLDFSLALSEFSCVERSIRHLRILFYSKDQEIFFPIKNDEWQLFVPDSMSIILFQEICKGDRFLPSNRD
jgi:Surface-adhesin protein E